MMPVMESSESFMHRALQLAWQGRGFVEPNPMVGCVLVRDGVIIGQGFHERFGQAHAEVRAIADCVSRGHDPAGSTAFVTLEPCCHTGKTGPCTEALLSAKVARVVGAMVDPDERVSGKGFDRLRSAGVSVEVGLCEALARRLSEPFIKRVTTGLPWVIGKWAQTIDGRIATCTGDSRWVSGEESRRAVHQLRARVDAVMIGIGTALADDPMLTARNVRVRRIARRIVVDPGLRLPVTSQLVRTARSDGAVTVLTTETAIASRGDEAAAALREAGVEVVALPLWEQGGDGRTLSLRAWLSQQCSQRGMQNVLVEGGAGLIGSLLQQALVDRALVHVSPKVLGDERAIGAVRGFDRARMDQATALQLVRVKCRGSDVELDYRVTRSS